MPISLCWKLVYGLLSRSQINAMKLLTQYLLGPAVHELQVLTERIGLCIEMLEMSFLRSVAGLSLEIWVGCLLDTFWVRCFCLVLVEWGSREDPVNTKGIISFIWHGKALVSPWMSLKRQVERQRYRLLCLDCWAHKGGIDGWTNTQQW